MKKVTRKYSGPKGSSIHERNYVEEPYRNNQANYPDEAKGSQPVDDEEFIPAMHERKQALIKDV